MCDVCKYVCVHMGGGGEGGVGVQMTYSICLERGGGGAICRRVLRNTRTRSSMLFLLHFYLSLLKR